MKDKLFIVTDNLKFAARVKEISSFYPELFDFSGFVTINNSKLDYRNKIIGNVAELSVCESPAMISIAIEDNKIREMVWKSLRKNRNLQLVSLVHPKSIIHPNSSIGKGLIAFEHSSVRKNTRLKKLVILESNSTIEENSRIGKYSYIGKNSSVSSNCILLKGVNVRNDSQIFRNVVLDRYETVAPYCLYLGN